MKKRISKVFTALTVTFILFVVSACGNQPSAETFDNETEIEESTIETETIESEEETAENESSESEEIEPIEIASSHQHNIDMEEKIKEIDTEEEVQSQTTTTQKKETEVQTSSATTTAETTTVTAPSTPDMGQLEEWMPPINMLVVCDANVVDENGNVLGSIAKGSDIGVSGQCPGFYQVNYGAKRSFLPKDCLSSR